MLALRKYEACVSPYLELPLGLSDSNAPYRPNGRLRKVLVHPEPPHFHAARNARHRSNSSCNRCHCLASMILADRLASPVTVTRVLAFDVRRVPLHFGSGKVSRSLPDECRSPGRLVVLHARCATAARVAVRWRSCAPVG